MKFSLKSFTAICLLMVFTLASCHRQGCPGQITDIDESVQIEQNC